MEGAKVHNFGNCVCAVVGFVFLGVRLRLRFWFGPSVCVLSVAVCCSVAMCTQHARVFERRRIITNARLVDDMRSCVCVFMCADQQQTVQAYFQNTDGNSCA